MAQSKRHTSSSKHRTKKGKSSKGRPKTFNPKVVYEDNHLLVINKPHGMPSQPDSSGDQSALDWGKAYIKEKYNKPGDVFMGVVHRLDRPVGGLLILARTSKAASRMAKVIQDQCVEKVYTAMTDSLPDEPERILEYWIEKKPGHNIVSVTTRKRGSEAKLAQMHFKIKRVVGKRALLEVRIFTGRRHQIRAMLSKIDCPIVGDLKYGWTGQPLRGKNIGLYATELAFKHPTQPRTIRLRINPPMAEDPWRDYYEQLNLRPAHNKQ